MVSTSVVWFVIPSVGGFADHIIISNLLSVLGAIAALVYGMPRHFVDGEPNAQLL